MLPFRRIKLYVLQRATLTTVFLHSTILGRFLASCCLRRQPQIGCVISEAGISTSRSPERSEILHKATSVVISRDGLANIVCMACRQDNRGLTAETAAEIARANDQLMQAGHVARTDTNLYLGKRANDGRVITQRVLTLDAP